MKYLKFSFQVTKPGATEMVKCHYFITLETIVIWKNIYIKTIIFELICVSNQGIRVLWFICFHHNLTSTLFEHSYFGMFLFCFNCQFKQSYGEQKAHYFVLGFLIKVMQIFMSNFYPPIFAPCSIYHRQVISIVMIFFLRGLSFRI